MSDQHQDLTGGEVLDQAKEYAQEHPEQAKGAIDALEDKLDEVELHPGDFPLGEIYKLNVDETGSTPDGEDAYVPSGKRAVLPIHDRFVHCLILGVTCGPVPS